MIRSMTGFGRGEYSDGKRMITAEIRSINHRYNDILIRIPKRYAFVEEHIRKTVKNQVSRGKIEISVNIENFSEGDVNIVLNEALAVQYNRNLKELTGILGLKMPVSIDYIASLPDVMKAVPAINDESETVISVCTAVENAVNALDDMRCIEGEKLAEDIKKRALLIDKMVSDIEERSPIVVKENHDRLKKRISELLGDVASVSEDRIVMEAALFADKINVTEETVRLHSHISQLLNIIDGNTRHDGKKLDFIAQEMNRETNTIGSKANDLIITDKVLVMKSEIEKIREQVQNIE